MDTRAFFSAIYPDGIPAGAYLLIWTLPSKRSVWCRTINQAVKAVLAARHEEDVYFGVGLSPQDFGPHQRCDADQVCALPGLWVDLDFASPHHKKENLPGDVDDILALLGELGIPPTLINHSGHGLQGFWLFKELWEQKTPEERAEAASLSLRWIRTIQHHAARYGWEVDATQDLARVLRVPGSFNHKGGEKTEVVVFSSDGPHCNPSDLDELAVDGEEPGVWSGEGEKEPEGEPLILRPDAAPPIAKFATLCREEPRFYLSWEKRRKDLKDQTFSSYDYSLVNFAITAGWTDQEIANLIIAFRREKGTAEDLEKATNPRGGYCRRTITKCRKTAQREAAQETFNDYCSEREGVNGTPPPDREKLIADLGIVLEVPLKRIVKYVPMNTYHLETDKASYPLGDVNGLIQHRRFRSSLADAAGWMIPMFVEKHWRPIAQALLDICEEDDAGRESDEAGTLRNWLRTYLDRNKPCPESEGAISERVPILRDGVPHIFLDHFLGWLSISKGERVSVRMAAPWFREIGSKPYILNCTLGTKKTTREIWPVPELDEVVL